MDELVEAGLLTCKICGKVFGSVRGKHLHISKAHKVKLKDYYKKFYPKKSKLYNKTIAFKNVKQYFDTDFLNRQEIIEWSLNEDKKITSEYLKQLLINRKNKKNIIYSLSEVELELCDFPNIECFKHVFGSYSKICDHHRRMFQTDTVCSPTRNHQGTSRRYQDTNLLLFSSSETANASFKSESKPFPC